MNFICIYKYHLSTVWHIILAYRHMLYIIYSIWYTTVYDLLVAYRSRVINHRPIIRRPSYTWEKWHWFQLVDHICQFMDVSKTDEVLSDYLTSYKIGGIHGDKDPTSGTMKCLWASFRRQFAQRGLTVTPDNFPKSNVTVQNRRQTLRKTRFNPRKTFFTKW